MSTVSMASLRPGQSIRELDPDVLSRIVSHPLQQANVRRVALLLDGLNLCDSAEDYFEFQRHLFRAMLEATTRRADCTRVVKRLRQARGVPADAPELPANGDPSNSAAWVFEVFVAERLARQLRCVGDGLAWRAFHYDRRVVAALSRNDSPGPLIESEGLGYELGRVVDLWKNRRHFGLLHDLTNCLRIADVTEFVTDGGRLLHEVKKKAGGRATTAQKARMRAAIDAVNDGGVLPGDGGDARLAVLSTRYRADLAALRDAIGLAQSRGVQGIRLGEGRALVVASLRDLARRWADEPAQGIDAIESARAAAIRRAGIAHSIHHLTGNSGDTASRSPIAAPLAIFPLDSADRAELICDLLTFETVVSLDHIVQLLEERDLQVEVLLPAHSQQIAQDADVLKIRLRDRSLTVHAPAMNPLMFELLRPTAWSNGIAELMSLVQPPRQPEVVLADEAAVWR